jgi:hypothetical protein
MLASIKLPLVKIAGSGRRWPMGSNGIRAELLNPARNPKRFAGARCHGTGGAG